MIPAIIVHHAEQRNLVMRRRPKDAWRIHQIAVTLDIHREAAVFTIGERRADCGGRAVADAVASLCANVLVVPIEIPQALGPAVLKNGRGNKRPIAALDLVPDFSAQARRADGAGVPGDGSGFAIALQSLLVGLG